MTRKTAPASLTPRPSVILPGVRFEGNLVIHEDLEAKRSAPPFSARSQHPAALSPNSERSSCVAGAVVVAEFSAVLVGTVVAKMVVFPAIGAVEVAKDTRDGNRVAQSILLYVALLCAMGALIGLLPKLTPLWLMGMVAAFPLACYLRLPRK